MPIPELNRRAAERKLQQFCRERAPRALDPAVRLTYTFDADGVTLSEEAPGVAPLPLARFRFTVELGQWSLHRPDPRGWVLDRSIPPALDFDRLLAYLDQDPFKHYWK